jgi:hypothetical protein
MTVPFSDDHVHQQVYVTADALRLYIASVRYYESQLSRDAAFLSTDKRLRSLFAYGAIEHSPIWEELEHVSHLRLRLEEWRGDDSGREGYFLNLSHSYVRAIKAMAFLYIEDLHRRRAELTKSAVLSAAGIDSLDWRLAQFEEKIDLGIFHGAEPWPLLRSASSPASPVASQGEEASPPKSRARILRTIEVTDPELRERCLDLLEQFAEAGEDHRYDTAIMEATRVLENRVRAIARLAPGEEGKNLMATVFGGTPRIRLSEHAGEQEAALHLFRGVYGFVRNPVHHRIIAFERERALQIVAFIDYLLSLLENASLAIGSETAG